MLLDMVDEKCLRTKIKKNLSKFSFRGFLEIESYETY